MDEKAKKTFDKILAKTPEELIDHEIAFLKARRSYLKPHQKEEFKSVLETKPSKRTVKKDAKKEK